MQYNARHSFWGGKCVVIEPCTPNHQPSRPFRAVIHAQLSPHSSHLHLEGKSGKSYTHGKDIQGTRTFTRKSVVERFIQNHISSLLLFAPSD
jgi:hypothetical protein